LINTFIEPNEAIQPTDRYQERIIKNHCAVFLGGGSYWRGGGCIASVVWG